MGDQLERADTASGAQAGTHGHTWHSWSSSALTGRAPGFCCTYPSPEAALLATSDFPGLWCGMEGGADPEMLASHMSAGLSPGLSTSAPLLRLPGALLEVNLAPSTCLLSSLCFQGQGDQGDIGRAGGRGWGAGPPGTPAPSPQRSEREAWSGEAAFMEWT